MGFADQLAWLEEQLAHERARAPSAMLTRSSMCHTRSQGAPPNPVNTPEGNHEPDDNNNNNNND